MVPAIIKKKKETSMEFTHLFNQKIVQILKNSGSSKRAPVNEKLLDLYLDESLTGSLDISDKRIRQRKIIKILKVLYPIAFTNREEDQLEDPKFLEFLRKSKNLSSDIKKDLSDIFNLMRVARVPKIYKELGVGEKDYMKRSVHIKLRKDLLKGLRDFERTNNKEMSKEEKAEIRRIFHDLELRHLDPFIYIAEVLDEKDIGFEVLNIFLAPGGDYTNPLDRKRAVIEYRRALLAEYLEHLDKFPTKPYILNTKAFDSRLVEKEIQR